MVDVVEARHVDGYMLELKFENGKTGRFDFSSYAKRGGVFSHFSDIGYFKQFRVNKELGVLCWPDGQDVAPETLYHVATGEALPAWMNEESLTKR